MEDKNKEMERPFPDSYWVRPGRLLAGEYPGAPHDMAARHKLQRLLDAGITFFLDLTQAGEYGLRPYAPLLDEIGRDRPRPVVHRRMPIPDMGTPAAQTMVEILDTIDDALASGHGVYVHCFGGIGRTGTVIGCYLARKGMGGEAALEQIARWRQGTPDAGYESPQTRAQREMVRTWLAGQ